MRIITMRHPFILLIFVLTGLFSLQACSPPADDSSGEPTVDSLSSSTKPERKRVRVGAERLLEEKLILVRNQRIAIVANQTSLVYGNTHLVDTLHSLGINITKVFAPEHGFRGDHDAGAKVQTDVDEKTGIPLVSLYGKNKKPSAAQLEDVDIVLFDIQDVGARFYTYISTMSYVMEACAENNKQVFILDRPNPNGWYVDGPVMEEGFTSFVGMHVGVPISHGMTVGEYARMVNHEGWLADGKKCDLKVIDCENYSHGDKWEETGLDWVPPSPNLATEYAAYLYPMLCWFEGTPMSLGRGTDSAFTIYGAPWHEGYHVAWMKDSVLQTQKPGLITLYGLEMEHYFFTPRSIPGKSTYPKYQDQKCWGVRFVNRVPAPGLFQAGLSMLGNIEEEKQNVGLAEPIFQPFFDKLVGNDRLKTQIRNGDRPETIYAGWQPDIEAFKKIRKKYLLYADFE